MVASPGSPGDGEPVCGLTTRTAVNVAYGGVYSPQDMDIYAQVLSDALAQGCHVPLACRFYIPLGAREMKEYCAERGYLKIFYKTGVTVIEPDDCAAGTASAADLRASPGMIEIGRRNFPRCGSAEQIFLASPFTVAASAVAGYLVEYKLEETRRLARAA